MVIGLDWDGTVTRDPLAMTQVARLLKQAGHTVYIVTMRYASECVEILKLKAFMDSVEGVVPTARGAKGPAMWSLGIKVDVWVDDNPRAVSERACQIWGTESPEGEVWIETANGPVVVSMANATELIDPYKKLMLPWPMDKVDTESTLIVRDMSPEIY